MQTNLLEMGDIEHRPEWSEAEQAEVDRIEAGNPSPPNAELRYTLADCFMCGKVTVARFGGPRPESCSNCGKPIVAVVVGQLPELSDPDAKQLGSFARNSETSRQAALAVYPRQGTDRWKILYLLDLASKSGMPGHTRDEMARHVGLPGNTVRPRVRELMDGGWIEQARDEDGKLIRRLSDAGHPADVVRLTTLAREAIRREHEDTRRARFDAGA